MPLASAPLDDQAIAGLFAGLEGAPAIVLAVSGGPDSMALLRLASRWAVAGRRPSLHVATVDHCLRPEAAAEAAFVAAAAADLGLPHTTLIWRGAKPATRIQERARAARYGLLVEHARSIGAISVLTAHHADDQAETVLMRLGRGSGVRGLSGMRRDTVLASGIALVRPFLELPKSTLVALCRYEKQAYVDDPSNADATFARVRLRANADIAADVGLDRANLLRLARRMARAEAALDAEVRRLEAVLRPERAHHRWRASLATTRWVAPEVLQRLLRLAIEDVAGATTLRLERLETASDSLARALQGNRAHRATLGGARIVLGTDASLIVTREPPRLRGRAPVAAVIDAFAVIDVAVIKAELTR